ncbi:Uncharacterised protein [Mycobacterium tuberculosis]|uniref:Uncharacterized protein n=1 Tax=Mycobacterium tuberculosis TaxID=1773 RepID=A0A916LGZ0_MYCTX|nr:Uncharacterised protein [Mycobacterium tuberculosis]COY57104.1 Uncharacterised protein [Mycobacterium tuberculosis]CPB77581.1 Uncharacterised protein [Mycobacterium tuberculosis]
MSIRRDSWRSVPSTYRPPASITSLASLLASSLTMGSSECQAASYSSGVSTGSRPRSRSR